ncbi:hypothetical protein LTR08_007954 [Meristemomyces frigidus]|nr:hypothetical protein LTR08_007954 [Meristemomyces frigidus]
MAEAQAHTNPWSAIDCDVLKYAVTEQEVLRIRYHCPFSPERLLESWQKAMSVILDPNVDTNDRKKEDARAAMVDMSDNVRRILAKPRRISKRVMLIDVVLAEAVAREQSTLNKPADEPEDVSKRPEPEAQSEAVLPRPTSPVIQSLQQETDIVVETHGDGLEEDLYTSSRPVSPSLRMWALSLEARATPVPAIVPDTGAPWMPDADTEHVESACAPAHPRSSVDQEIGTRAQPVEGVERDRALKGMLMITNPDGP